MKRVKIEQKRIITQNKNIQMAITMPINIKSLKIT